MSKNLENLNSAMNPSSGLIRTFTPGRLNLTGHHPLYADVREGSSRSLERR